MSLEERKKKCPRCGAVITFYPAISRKDNKTEICSDCGVIEAIEEYINHKNKLEVGMYVRYIPTIGEYTQKISKITKTKNCLLDMCYTLDDKEEVFSSHFDDILGASYNIIDLIEVGDYVNGYPVYETIEYPDNTRAIVIADDNKSIIWEESSQYIKSILTKEQFESMSYEVE